jgi:hypothetical protein
MPGSNSETRERFCDGLGSNIGTTFCWSHYYLHGRINAREYVAKLGNQVHPMIQTLLPYNDAVFQEDIAPILTAGTVQPWHEEHEAELYYFLWSAQSPDFNFINHCGQFWTLECGTDSHL